MIKADVKLRNIFSCYMMKEFITKIYYKGDGISLYTLNNNNFIYGE